MFSILDILRKHREDKGKPPASAEKGMPLSPFFPETDAPRPAPAARQAEPGEPVSIFSALNKELVEENSRQAAVLYEEALTVARRVYVRGGCGAEIIDAQLDPLLDRSLAALSGGNREFLKLFLAPYPDLKDLMYRHAVNVCFLCAEFGLQLKYEPAALRDLAKAAFLHDIGMTDALELIQKPGIFTAEETARIRLHAKTGIELTTRINRNFSHFITDVIVQEHERLDGSGYPKGLKGDDVSEQSRIVGLADVYEAMVHARPHRLALSPSEAINVILNGKGVFDPRMIKVLIERVGVFPEGTKVRLNTKETGVVIRVNPYSPLRPIVNVTVDADGNELKTAKELNLCKNYLIHIEESLGK